MKYILTVLLIVPCALTIAPATPRWKLRCGKPPKAHKTMTLISADKDYYRYEKAWYRCKSGMKIKGQMDNNRVTATLKCQRGRRWESPVPRCEAIVDCEPLPSGVNVEPVPQVILQYPDHYVYSCLPGHISQDSMVAVCLPNGKLSIQSGPLCSEVTCDSPLNGTRTVAVADGDTYSVAESFTYECEAGFDPADGCSSLVTTCMGDGSWSADPPICMSYDMETTTPGDEEPGPCGAGLGEPSDITSGAAMLDPSHNNLLDGLPLTGATSTSGISGPAHFSIDMGAPFCIDGVKISVDFGAYSFDILVKSDGNPGMPLGPTLCATTDTRLFIEDSFYCTQSLTGQYVVIQTAEESITLNEVNIYGWGPLMN